MEQRIPSERCLCEFVVLNTRIPLDRHTNLDITPSLPCNSSLKCNVWLLINAIAISGKPNLMYIWSEASAIKVSIDLLSVEDSTGALEP